MSTIEHKLGLASKNLQKNLTDRQLFNLYTNLQNYISSLSLNDQEQYRELIEDVLSELENKYRIAYPISSKKLYGAKDAEISELLEKALLLLQNKYDLSKNEVKSYVKTGGDMISGRRYICKYLSYRNSQKQVCFLGISQKTINDPIICKVITYTAYATDKSNDKTIDFPFKDFDQALSLYETYLSQYVFN